MLELMCLSGAYQIRNHARILGKFSDKLGVNGGFEDFLEEAYDHLYRQRGFIYAPQRKPLDFPGRSRMRHVFFLRDPRDVLVSGWHSFAFTHVAPKQPLARAAFEERRRALQEMGLEAYAVETCENWIKPLLVRYRALRATSNSNILIKYDEYRENPSVVMDRIADYLGVQIDPAQRDLIARKAAPVTREVNESSHKRSGRSGQFRTELSAQVQERLNASLADELKYWGFPEA